MTDTPDAGSSFVADFLRSNHDVIPAPYGVQVADEQSGAIATPLLAGFSLTTATVVLTSANKFRWADLVLLALVVSVFAFVSSVQAAQWATSYRVSPVEVRAWWPHMTESQRDARFAELRRHHIARGIWLRRQRISYHVGILGLLAGLSLAMVPPHVEKGPGMSTARQISIWTAGLAFAMEVLWIAARWIARWGLERRSGVRWQMHRMAAWSMGERS